MFKTLLSALWTVFRKAMRNTARTDASFFLLLVVLSLLICVSYIPLWYVTGNLYQVWVNSLCAFGYLAVAFLIIKNFEKSTYLHAFFMVGIVNISSVALTNYSSSAAFLVWMLIQPISSFYFFTQRTAVFQCGLTLCFSALIPLLSGQLNQHLIWDERTLHLTIFSSFVCIFIYITLMGYYHSNTILRKSRTLELKNKHLLRTQHRILENEKFKNKFIADMNHELRTPLNAILGITRIIQTENKPLEAQNSHVRLLQRSSEQLLQIINEVLDLSKVNSKTLVLHPRPFLVQELMDAAVDLIQPSVQSKGLQIETHIDPLIKGHRLGDRPRIMQILNNLLNNAVKFTQSGHIHLDVRLESENSDQLVFSVRDTGIGIAPEHLNDIFDEFNQGAANTHLEYGGSGLGLHITKRFVEMMNGRIACESTLGKGSVFTFALPLPKVELTPHPQPEEPHLQNELITHFPNTRILVVDDNRVNLMVTNKLIKTHLTSFTVDTLENPVDIATMMEKNNYHIMLLDINVPGHDMLEVSSEIKRAFPRCKLIAHTADSTFALSTEYQQSCFDEILIKPFILEELYRKFYQLLTESS
jgi:signal transduction histidine kinase/CheY-like chemotaxis protein